MKKIFLFLLIGGFAGVACAGDKHSRAHSASPAPAAKQSVSKQKVSAQENTLKLKVIDAQPLRVGKKNTVHLALVRIANGKAVTLDELKEVHTKKFHALIIDPSLTDYHHVHPTVAENGGYEFTFTPQKPGDYRIFADVTPLKSGAQEYVVADLKGSEMASGTVDESTINPVMVGKLRFTLTFDSALHAGKAATGKIVVTKKDKPFTDLEPAMGAYAHIVGFNHDRTRVLHVHPLGEEPKDDNARGGPELAFHIEPSAPGFTKLFAQVRVDGDDIFVPFGVVVK